MTEELSSSTVTTSDTTTKVTTGNIQTTAQADKSNVGLMAKRFRGFYPVVVDVETAGFNAATDALLEFSAITLQFNEQGDLVPKNTYFYRIKPFEGSNIVKANIDFIGIDPFDPKRIAFTEKEIFPSFFKSIAKEVKAAGCSRAVLVGHNAHFDHGFLNAVTARLNYKRSPFHPFSVIDTASLSALVLGQTVLGVSCLIAGLDFKEEDAHSALYDTQKEAQLFCFFVNRYKELGGWPLPENMLNKSSNAVLEHKAKVKKGAINITDPKGVIYRTEEANKEE